MFYPDTFLLGSILTKRYLCIHGSNLRYTKYGLCTRQIKMTDQRKPRKNAPYNWFKLLCWVTQTLPLCLPVCLSTCIVLFLLLVNTLLTSLLSVFVEILFWKVKESGLLSLTSGLVARIWCCHHCEPAPVSAWESKPRSKLLQLRPPEINMSNLKRIKKTSQYYHPRRMCYLAL